MNKITDRAQLLSELRSSFKGYYGKIIRRLIAIGCLFFIIVTVFLFISQTFREYMDDKNLVNCKSICQRDYYSRDFADMLDTLNLYDPNQKQLDKYWEIALTYENYSLYRLWKEASDINPDYLNYQEKYKDYAQQVLTAYEQSSDEENKDIMEGYVKEIEQNLN